MCDHTTSFYPVLTEVEAVTMGEYEGPEPPEVAYEGYYGLYAFNDIATAFEDYVLAVYVVGGVLALICCVAVVVGTVIACKALKTIKETKEYKYTTV